ncbi:acetyltransferase [Francisellaceae bacterium]|nr:acetyltransferase [Francisellaceae bacterium]
MSDLLIIGAGGHAKVVFDCASQQGLFGSYTVVDSDKHKWGKEFLDTVICTEIDINPDDYSGFVCAIGHDQIRKTLFQKYLKLGVTPVNVIHPNTYISSFCDLGLGIMMMKGATVHPDAEVGDNVIVNTHAIIEHDVKVADHVQISPGAIICGNVSIGSLSFVGAGAVIKQGVAIGQNCMIAAGAVVVKDVPDGQLVKGIPAK